MKNKMKITVGDSVLVISGKNRGKSGKISQVIAEKNWVVVDGVNKTVKHLKSGQKDQKGQRIEFFGPIHVSNVMLIDEDTGKPGRVGYQVTAGENGKAVKTRKVKVSKNRKKVVVQKEAEVKEEKAEATEKKATKKKSEEKVATEKKSSKK